MTPQDTYWPPKKKMATQDTDYVRYKQTILYKQTIYITLIDNIFVYWMSSILLENSVRTLLFK